MRVLLILSLLLLAGPTYAGLCSERTAGYLSLFMVSEESGMRQMREECKPGDIVYVPRSARKTMATQCDVSKLVPTDDGLMLCVYTPPKE